MKIHIPSPVDQKLLVRCLYGIAVNNQASGPHHVVLYTANPEDEGSLRLFGSAMFWTMKVVAAENAFDHSDDELGISEVFQDPRAIATQGVYDELNGLNQYLSSPAYQISVELAGIMDSLGSNIVDVFVKECLKYPISTELLPAEDYICNQFENERVWTNAICLIQPGETPDFSLMRRKATKETTNVR